MVQENAKHWHEMEKPHGERMSETRRGNGTGGKMKLYYKKKNNGWCKKSGYKLLTDAKSIKWDNIPPTVTSNVDTTRYLGFASARCTEILDNNTELFFPLPPTPRGFWACTGKRGAAECLESAPSRFPCAVRPAVSSGGAFDGLSFSKWRRRPGRHIGRLRELGISERAVGEKEA